MFLVEIVRVVYSCVVLGLKVCSSVVFLVVIFILNRFLVELMEYRFLFG